MAVIYLLRRSSRSRFVKLDRWLFFGPQGTTL